MPPGMHVPQRGQEECEQTGVPGISNMVLAVDHTLSAQYYLNNCLCLHLAHAIKFSLKSSKRRVSRLMGS